MNISRRKFMSVASAAAVSVIAAGSIAASPLAAAQSSKTILLTAYEPFGGRSFNNAMLVGNFVSEKLSAAGYEVTYITIPTEWASFKENLTQAVTTLQPETIISLGEVGQVATPTVELMAYNAGYGNDATGNWFTGQIDPQGPAKREVPAENKDAQKAVANAGYKLNTSTDAGRYLCNAALYTNLGFLEQGLVRHAGFVHVPARASETDPGIEGDADTVTEFIKTLVG